MTLNAGTSGSPFQTIGKANSVGSVGDSAFLQNSSATFGVCKSQSNLSIVGESVTGVVLDGAAGDVGWSVQNNLTISNVTIQNVRPTAAYSRAPIVVGQNGVVATVSKCAFKNILFTSYGAVFSGNQNFSSNTAVFGVS